MDDSNWTWQYLDGGRSEITIFRSQRSLSAPTAHPGSPCARPGSQNICFCLLFPMAAFQLDFLKQVPACHCSQGLLAITPVPTLRRRFRAKLITSLPFWLITAMLSRATCHLHSFGRALFFILPLHGIGFVPLIPGVVCEKTLSLHVSTDTEPKLSSFKHKTHHALCAWILKGMCGDSLSSPFSTLRDKKERNYHCI